ncbi:MAG TPA: diguanylate cyclase [Accumulibacter sp.]|nr:diguanylate cyclase [Accumulibacter sp.]
MRVIRFVDPIRYKKLRATGNLPSPKGFALAIVKLLQRDDFQITELVRLVQSDPAIAGRLLQLSNAAIFGRPRPIVSLQHAIVALGAFSVRDMVIGLSIMAENRQGHCSAFDYAAFWGHSLATAIACQELARYAQMAAEEIFTVGLLARVGELALATLLPEEYAAILLTARKDSLSLVQSEREAFAMDHRQLGASMLAEWGLPEWLIQAAYHHEDPDSAGFTDGSRQQTLTLSLNFASALGQVCMANDESRWHLLPSLLTRAAKLGLNVETLNQMVDRIIVRWRDWGAILHVRTQDLPPFANILAANPPSPRVKTASPEHAKELANPLRPIQLFGIESEELSWLRQQLSGLGFQPVTIDGAGEGLRQILHQPARIIIVNVNLSVMSPAAFCQQLRQTSKGKDSHIILLAPAHGERLVTEAVEAGVDDVLIKPLSLQALRLRLNTAIRMQSLQEEIQRERRDTVRSADEFAALQKRLLQEVLTDPLTELPNRRHGLDFLATEWAFARSSSLSIACLMMDIDHFKQINDQLGHAAGDAVLRQVAALLRQVTRSTDLLFRFGGEEFAVVLPNASLQMAARIAERFRHLVEHHAFHWENQTIPVSMSVGVALAKATGNNFGALVEAADAALYTAKKNGRNRVAIAKKNIEHPGSKANIDK